MRSEIAYRVKLQIVVDLLELQDEHRSPWVDSYSFSRKTPSVAYSGYALASQAFCPRDVFVLIRRHTRRHLEIMHFNFRLDNDVVISVRLVHMIYKIFLRRTDALWLV